MPFKGSSASILASSVVGVLWRVGEQKCTRKKKKTPLLRRGLQRPTMSVGAEAWRSCCGHRQPSPPSRSGGGGTRRGCRPLLPLSRSKSVACFHEWTYVAGFNALPFRWGRKSGGAVVKHRHPFAPCRSGGGGTRRGCRPLSPLFRSKSLAWLPRVDDRAHITARARACCARASS